MCGAIWSTSTKEVLNMPTRYILKFLIIMDCLIFIEDPSG